MFWKSAEFWRNLSCISEIVDWIVDFFFKMVRVRTVQNRAKIFKLVEIPFTRPHSIGNFLSLHGSVYLDG